jgi:hypothetical protein
VLAKFLTADSGARQFQGFHDTELDGDCSFQGTDDVRCLPSDDVENVYRDAACTSPLGAQYTEGECGGAPPSFVGTYSGDCGGGFDRIWKVGEPLGATAPIYTFDVTGACVMTTRSPSYTYYAAGDEMALDDFVGSHEEMAGDGRLRDQVRVGDDGSRVPWAVWDAELDTACWLFGDPARCLPEFDYADFDADDACSVPVIGRSGTCDVLQTSYIGEFRRNDTCGYTMKIFDNAGPTTPTTLYSGSSADSCAPVTISDLDYYAAGDEVDPTTFAEVERVVGDDDGRVRAYRRTADGYRAYDYGFHDAELDVDCWPTEVGGGDVRCLPGDLAGTVSLFEDAGCQTSTTLIEIYAPGECGDPDAPIPTRAVEWVYDTCTSTAHLHEIGAEVASGTPYSLDTGTCAPATWDTATVRRYRPGAELSFDEYAAFHPTTD